MLNPRPGGSLIPGDRRVIRDEVQAAAARGDLESELLAADRLVTDVSVTLGELELR